MNIQEIESKLRATLQEAKDDGVTIGPCENCALRVCARRLQLKHFMLTQVANHLFGMLPRQAFAFMSGWDGTDNGNILFEYKFSRTQDSAYFRLGNKLAEEFYRPVVNANA
jgi:hypothetical protein